MFVKTHLALTALLHLTTAVFWDGPQATVIEKRATDSFRPTPTPTFYPKAKGDIHPGVCGDYIIGNLSNPVSYGERFRCNYEYWLVQHSDSRQLSTAVETSNAATSTAKTS